MCAPGYEDEPGRYDDYHDQRYSPSPPSPRSSAAPYQQGNYFPASNNFPPPPNPGYVPTQNYNPANYPPPPPPPGIQGNPYGYAPQGGYTPPGEHAYMAPQSRGRRGDENVSAEPFLNNTETAFPAPATGAAGSAAALREEGGSGFDLDSIVQCADTTITQV